MSYFERIYVVRDVDMETELQVEPYNTTESGPTIRITTKKTNHHDSSILVFLDLDTAKALNRSISLTIRRAAAQFRKNKEKT
jgi:hypothetical protein